MALGPSARNFKPPLSTMVTSLLWLSISTDFTWSAFTLSRKAEYVILRPGVPPNDGASARNASIVPSTAHMAQRGMRWSGRGRPGWASRGEGGGDDPSGDMERG